MAISSSDKAHTVFPSIMYLAFMYFNRFVPSVRMMSNSLLRIPSNNSPRSSSKIALGFLQNIV